MDWKNVPISVSVSSNLKPRPIFLCNSDSRHLVSSFISALEGLATQGKEQMKLRSFVVETAFKMINSLVSWNNSTIDTANENESLSLTTTSISTTLRRRKSCLLSSSKCKKNQLIELREHFERYCIRLPVFGFNSAKYDISFIMSYLLPILVTERQIEPTVNKKANQFVSLKSGNVQLLDIMNFIGGATSLDSFRKAYKTKETQAFFLYEWFENLQKLNNKELLPYDSFSRKLRKNNLLEKGHNDFENLTTIGLTSERTV